MSFQKSVRQSVAGKQLKRKQGVRYGEQAGLAGCFTAWSQDKEHLAAWMAIPLQFDIPLKMGGFWLEGDEGTLLPPLA